MTAAPADPADESLRFRLGFDAVWIALGLIAVKGFGLPGWIAFCSIVGALSTTSLLIFQKLFRWGRRRKEKQA